MSTKYMTSRQPYRKPTGYENWSNEAIQARKRELEAWLLKKFPMPAGETDEDAHIDRVLEQYLKKRPTSATPTAAAPATAEAGDELLQEVTQFIARYLQCSEHQRTLLALWVLHTYCFCAARVTPYLAIRSADKESGKTLCLQLLSLLCDRAALTSGGFTARDLAVPMKEKPIAALLFDECHLTLGTRAHPRSPALRAVLAGSFHLGLGHRNIAEERNAFLPKAFASRGPLPDELADRCIPIILEPLRARKPTESATHPDFSSDDQMTRRPDDPIRFDLHHIADQIKPLRDRLERWTRNHFSLLTRRTLLPRSAFPPNLSPRQQDLCDPLLQIAGLVGGPWIARALQACAIVFDVQSIFELRPNLQLLADVRDCFAHHNWPDRLPTELLLDWTDSLPSRPWDAEGPLSAYKLARLLYAFGIRPRNQRIGKANPKRGYELKDFKEPWKKHFGFEVPQPKAPPAPASRGASHGSEIANKNAACNTVSHVGKLSAPTQRAAQAAKPPEESDGTVAAPAASSTVSSSENGRKRESVGVVTQAQLAAPSSKPAKDAACNTDSHVRKASVPTQPKAEIPNQKSESKPSAPPVEIAKTKDGERTPVLSLDDPMTRRPDDRGPQRADDFGARWGEGDPISPDTLHGIHRLKTLHSKLRLQGLCPPFEALAASYLPHHLHAALDWVEAHPEWCSNLRYKPALEFVAAFQKTLAS